MDNLSSIWPAPGKRRNSLAAFFLLLPLLISAVPDVSMDISRFRNGESPYIEVSLYIVGATLTCWPGLGNDYGVEYTLLVKDKEQQIVAGDKYRISSTNCPAKDLIDLKRFSLTPGQYLIEVDLQDIKDSTNRVTIGQEITIEQPQPGPSISDVQVLSVVKNDPIGESPLHKSGLYLEPLAFKYYYPSLNKLNLYSECYNVDKAEGQPYLQYVIKAKDGDIPPPMTAYKKVDKQSTVPNVYQLDITELITGPYIIETTLFDGNKNQLSSHVTSFSRYNPVGDSLFLANGGLKLETSFVQKIPEDSLDYSIKAMFPIVSSTEVEMMNSILKKGDADSKRFFIHRYWSEQAGKYGGQAYNSYMNIARYVDAFFKSGFGYGFETDRGHIFLKYGQPDDILEEESEPSAPPYEIWFYNSFPATKQSNVRFLFYNPSLAKNAYKLLHSTAIGEVKNERWELELYRDALTETPGVNEKTMGDNVHRNARKYFENF